MQGPQNREQGRKTGHEQDFIQVVERGWGGSSGRAQDVFR